MPLDPGRQWLEAGITGLARQREWDAVVTVEALAGVPGDEVELVVLPDGRVVVEDGQAGFDVSALVAGFEGRIEPPYRAVGVRRPELWVVGARAIEVVSLVPTPPGDELELTWDGASLSLALDRMPADPGRAAALEQLAAQRERGPYSAHAHRLRDDLWELSVLPL